MEQAELDAQARKWREAGLTYKEIGERLGESGAYAWKRVNREQHNAASGAYNKRVRPVIRARRREKRQEMDSRGSCTECGGPMGIGSEGESGRCTTCQAKAVDAMFRKYERLWAKGYLIREIADEFEVGIGTVVKRLDEGRERGYRLPYRQKGRVKGRKHPQQMT